MARGRETAQRVFAAEYNSSRHEDRGTEENAPNFIVTPLGCSVNRLLFMGVLMNKTNTGTGETPNYKAEVRDPTGTFFVYAGQFQPQALNALSSLEPPSLVGIVGKVRTFVKDDGTFYASVKPENVFPVDIPQRDRWILETSQFTLERVRALDDAASMESPTMEALLEKGHPRRAAESALESLRLYEGADHKYIINGIRAALRTVVEGEGKSLDEMPPAPTVPEKATPDVKEKVLDFIRELTGERGALYRDIMKRCEGEGIDKITLEETIQALLDEGQVYEPTIGIIKPI
jgi:RPA family protein